MYISIACILRFKFLPYFYHMYIININAQCNNSYIFYNNFRMSHFYTILVGNNFTVLICSESHDPDPWHFNLTGRHMPFLRCQLLLNHRRPPELLREEYHSCAYKTFVRRSLSEHQMNSDQ